MATALLWSVVVLLIGAGLAGTVRPRPSREAAARGSGAGPGCAQG